MLWLINLASVAYPSGFTGACNTDAYTLPDQMRRNIQEPPTNINITCVSITEERSRCTLQSETSFQGLLLSSKATLFPITENVKPGKTENCLTHTNSNAKTEVSFYAEGNALIYAVIVANKNNLIHNVYLVPPVLSNSINVYIIGAGPGGLAAAHYLQSKNVNFTIFERGSSEPTNFYQSPIAFTYHGRFLEENNEYK